MRYRAIRTQRLVLRRGRAADVPAVLKLLDDPSISKHIPHVPYPVGPRTAAKWLARVSKQRRDPVHGEGRDWVVERDGVIVGSCHLSWNAGDKRALFGYWVGKPFRGQGVATEVSRGLIDFAFGTLGAQKVWAGAFADNKASRRVLLKAGLREEAHLHSHVLDRGRRRGDVFYGMVRREWKRRAPRSRARA